MHQPVYMRLLQRTNRGQARIENWQFSRPVVAIRAVIILVLLHPVMAVFSARRSYGREKLATLEGPVIFAANHLSVVDNPAVLLALPWKWRLSLATAAAEEVMRRRGALQSFCAALISNAFFFSQTRHLRSSLENCSTLIESGWSVLFFPEGKRSQDGTIGPFRPGIGLLATTLGVPVVPVHLEGTNSVIALGGTRPRRGSITVRFGEPIRFSETTDITVASEQVREAILQLSDGRRGDFRRREGSKMEPQNRG